MQFFIPAQYWYGPEIEGEAGGSLPSSAYHIGQDYLPAR
jgi:hypothetical protein